MIGVKMMTVILWCVYQSGSKKLRGSHRWYYYSIRRMPFPISVLQLTKCLSRTATEILTVKVQNSCVFEYRPILDETIRNDRISRSVSVLACRYQPILSCA